MKRFYNENHGAIFYPETWCEAFRCLLAGFILGGFKRTWKGNPHWKTKPGVLGCVECELKGTQYPDLAGC